jgi:N-acetylglucosaminyldiphosphoundecaprenol N-acetyl-beta-D-mannosaminyltransferase
MSTMPDFIRVLNINVRNTDSKTLLRELHSGIVFTSNVDHLVNLQKDREFYYAYRHADYVLLDSQILFFLYALVGKRFREKISGVDFFPEFCRYHTANEGVKVFLLGGLDDSVHKAAEKLNGTIGREIIVGSYSAKKGFEGDKDECAKIVEIIARSGATVLAVGVGSPRQEKWIYNYQSQLPSVKLFFAVGGTFDVISGKRRRAPYIMQQLGIEWLFRIFQDPRRLFKRYFIIDVHFFYYFLLERLNLYHDPFTP